MALVYLTDGRIVGAKTVTAERIWWVPESGNGNEYCTGTTPWPKEPLLVRGVTMFWHANTCVCALHDLSKLLATVQHQ